MDVNAPAGREWATYAITMVSGRSAFKGRRTGDMTNRKLAFIVKDRTPLVLGAHETVQQACRCMWERRAGSVLVVDDQQRLCGIFTGRDAVRALAQGSETAATALAKAMTPNPVTIAPESRAIDALHVMSDGGFRHLPVVESGRILGIVSRGDFKGAEIDRLDEEERLWECIR
jgi:CBS domain-containing protein